MMRIIVELDPSVARPAIDLVERGQFGSMDTLVSEALSAFLADESRETRATSYPQCPRLLQAPAVAGALGDPLVNRAVPPVWVWGMVNRVFPLKIAARVVANLCGESGGVLFQVQTKTAECAAEVGAALGHDDQEHKRKRNDCRAVALPSGPQLQKSKVRFAHHFVGRRSSSGDYTGGAFETGLLGGIGSAAQWVAPTEQGWAFARLPNPVLDVWDEGSFGPSNLSEAEKEYYVLNIARAVPAEREAFTQVLAALSESPQTPQALAERVRPTVTPGSSQNVVTTTRSGALGRMADVGAIHRESQGRSALYSITSLGQQFLEMEQGGKP
jgi:hypothetical protein